jgi:SAM-dependent methyltransferase
MRFGIFNWNLPKRARPLRGMKNWFATWFDTEYYHKLYNNRDESEAHRFISNVLDFLQLPAGSKVLDIACGKGRHAKAISEKGYDVIGTDLSPNSISEANKIKNENLEFFVQDMREPFRKNEFDVAFNFFTSFGYFQTEEDNERAAQSMTDNVKEGGLLLIDFVNKAHALRNIEANQEEEQERDALHFDIERKFEDGRYVKNITVCDEDKCMRFQESLQSLTREDFVRYFNPLGMELEKVFGDYDLNEYSENDSPRLILLFRKK